MSRLYFFAFILWSAKVALAGTSVTFESIPERIENKNLSVEEARQNHAAAESRMGYLSRSFFPDIKGETDYENLTLNNLANKSQLGWRLEAGINIFRGGSDYFEEKLREHEAYRSKVAMSREVQSQVREAYELFWRLVAKKEDIESYRSYLDLAKKYLYEAERRINAGLTTGADRIEFEIKIATIKQDLARSEGEFKQIERKLALVLGIEGEITPQFSQSHNHNWESELQRISSVDTNDWQALRSEQRILGAKKAKLQGHYYPQIDLYGGIADPNFREQDDTGLQLIRRRESYYGVRASWSFGEALEASVESRALQKERQGLEVRERRIEQDIRLRQETRMEELRTLHSFVHDSEENIKLSRRFLDVSEKEFKRGVKGPTAMLAAADLYIASRLRLSEIMRDFNVLYSQQRAELLSK